MTEPPKSNAPPPQSAAPGGPGVSDAAKAAASEGNPVFRMMGLPKNFGKKLPSRNWMIFFTIVGAWTGAVVYDRQQKKRIQKKWTEAVSHLALEPLSPLVLPRKLTIFLSAPPADGLLTAREHYHEYVAPILVASGLDWDAVEGRKEGDVRAGLAERIRKLRKRRGEETTEPLAEDDLEILIDDMREKMGVRSVEDVRGDIVIGRNTWKEYIRGLHEGWLGPLDPPKTVVEVDAGNLTPKEDILAPNGEIPHAEKPHDIASIPNFAAEQVLQRLPHTSTPSSEFTSSTTTQTTADYSSPSAVIPPEPVVQPEDKEAETSKEDSTKPKKPPQPVPFISTDEYPSATISPFTPPEFAPSITIPVPHILGFMNTPIRIYRYLTKRYVADEIGRQVAAACFAAYAPYERRDSPNSPSSSIPNDDASPSNHSTEQPTASKMTDTWEQESLLKAEEPEWHKSVRKNHDVTKESVWMDPMVLDPRIAARMRKFVLNQSKSRSEQGTELS